MRRILKEIQRFRGALKEEHDSCGIVSFVEKENIPTKENIDNTIQALIKMNHRAGFINEEGDGVGIHMDIPWTLWKSKLKEINEDPSIVDSPLFIVGHLFIKKSYPRTKFQQEIKDLFESRGFKLLFESTNQTNKDALGPIARKAEPIFWQVALFPKKHLNPNTLKPQLFDLVLELEKSKSIHVASLSNETVVYKAMGAGDILPKYYYDLANPLVASATTLGHNRYSTNTLSSFFRVQPFSTIGHNGEINTIAKLRDEAHMVGVTLVDEGSDSQDLDRIINTFISKHDLTLLEAIEILFPPITSEISYYPDHLKDLYSYIRQAWGHFAQGPAGIISRFGDEAVYSVDSLGLRPLWMLETKSSYIFSSEQGIFTSDNYVSEPKPFAPGEKVALKRSSKGTIDVLYYDQIQEEFHNRIVKKLPVTGASEHFSIKRVSKPKDIFPIQDIKLSVYKANGWEREHIQLIKSMSEKGIEPIRSLGHDTPLAAMNPYRKNLPDFIKESVAVVTNPAIDRDREMEHFTTIVVIGKRPSLFNESQVKTIVELNSPIIAEGISGKILQGEFNYLSYEGLIEHFHKGNDAQNLSLVRFEHEEVDEALQRLKKEAHIAVKNGKSLLLLDDSGTHEGNCYWLDPHLALSTLDLYLKEKEIRRECSLVLRSGSIRSLHDIAIAIGLGADLINPYMMFLVVSDDPALSTVNLHTTLIKGLEKIISTMGIHELRGYGRLFSSIGLSEESANSLNIVNYFASKTGNYSYLTMKEDSIDRKDDYYKENVTLNNSYHSFPFIWKSIYDLAAGKTDYKFFRDKLNLQEVERPTAIRHLVDLKTADTNLDPKMVDVSIGTHNLPFMISSMSFGSQNEIAFRAYAEAAHQLNMLSFNGEGGEIKDMLGKYPNTRGHQVASGRFGVNIELLNSSNLIELKIGQGAKPGEGGHLPGSKVTVKVAQARNTTPGSDLISPSNNHDIYSIEDLAQMILELKTANDKAKIAVKVPIVPNIGTIAVGIAKAGADFITLSGFDGGTGAARVHAIQHVGLPVEIGIKAAHFALLEAGLRQRVELWADGGIRSVQDAVKLMLLGANRIGFGTIAMIAIGCTACRGCHLGTCHVGISTQIQSIDQAKEQGLRTFAPRDYDNAVKNLVTLFSEFSKELQRVTASLGYTRTQDIVGRADLLVQTRGHENLNLKDLLTILPISPSVLDKAVKDMQNQKSLFSASENFEHLDSNTIKLAESREFKAITAEQRVIGSRVACHRVRGKLGSYRNLPEINLRYTKGSILGNGFGAYNSSGLNLSINGGAQDGVGKTSFGGSVKIFKTKGIGGQFINGSVGKGVGYGSQQGTFIIQGYADSRAGIRLSGADMIFGGRVTKPISKGRRFNVGVHSNIKGFAFEYMTNGRGLVMGDPGPWMCAGMTGGVIYLRLDPQMGLDQETLKSRIAKSAKVVLEPLSEKGVKEVIELLNIYRSELAELNQEQEIALIDKLLEKPSENFLQVVPVNQQTQTNIATE